MGPKAQRQKRKRPGFVKYTIQPVAITTDLDYIDEIWTLWSPRATSQKSHLLLGAADDWQCVASITDSVHLLVDPPIIHWSNNTTHIYLH